MPSQSTAVPRRSLDTFSLWALLITFAAALFFFMPSATMPLTATKTFLLAAGALITLALYILARLGRGNVIFPPSLLLPALWLPTLAYALSTAFSGIPFADAFWGTALETDTFGFILIASVLGTLAALVLRRTEHYASFLRASAVIFCLVAILQVLIVVVGQFAPNLISPAFSIVGSYDALAMFLGLGIISTLLAFRFLSPSGRSQKVLLLGGVAALAVLAIANATLIWVLVALVSLGLFVEAVMRRSSSAADADLDDATVVVEALPSEGGDTNRPLLFPLVTLAVSLFFLIGGTLGTALASSLQVNVLSVRPSWQSTLAVGQQAYTTAPIFGSGPGTFVSEWLKYRDATLNTTVFWNVDFASGIGFIPTSFITTGVFGVLAWIGFLGLFLWFGSRMLIRRTPRDPFIAFVSILSFVATLYLFIISIFDLPNAILLALAFVFAGVFISTTRYAEGKSQWGVSFSRSPRIGFVIVFSLTILLLSSVGAAYALVGHYIAAAELAKANTALAANNLDAADRAAQNAISFAPSASAYQIQAGVASARLNQIVASQTLSVSAAQQAFQSSLSSGVNAALTATRLAPRNYQSWVVLGNLYAQAVPLTVEGAYNSAKTAYEKAKELNPTNPQIPFVLAQLEIANKNSRAAIDYLKSAIALKQDYTDAIFLLSQLEVQVGNVQGALAAALAAAYFTPNNPNILFQVGILYAAQNDLVNATAALNAAVDASPQFANARYFLSAVYAKRGDLVSALTQMQAIAAMSEENARAVATQLATLEAKKNPFPANLLSITPAP